MANDVRILLERYDIKEHSVRYRQYFPDGRALKDIYVGKDIIRLEFPPNSSTPH